ncbi:uncharacterized protein B0H18DRAFT_998059 [Fomitopsis serialis]|uniref:uncharacterized protein n=1 Tax=Fomitopsis serialis TaxID=139415 RepID=UPI0020076171|nr:uncharacterized protein B0H18DRAFT_998059 [Neoantrodia serialis]KAH9929197.1 hypothetical protein B0H18DRAFT_998059 [Neoantrodia serialis]
MASPTDSPYPTTLRYLTLEGSAIQVDPLTGPSLKFGQHNRFVKRALLNASFIDVKKQHTVEQLFNRMMREIETIGMAANFLYYAHDDFERRLGRTTVEMLQNQRDMSETMRAIEPMMEHLAQQFEGLEHRVRAVEKQLAHLRKPGVAKGVPTSSKPAGKTAGHEHGAEVTTATATATSLTRGEKQTIRRCGGTSYGTDHARERVFPAVDAEIRTGFLTEMLQERHSREGRQPSNSSRDETEGEGEGVSRNGSGKGKEKEKVEERAAELLPGETRLAEGIVQSIRVCQRDLWTRTFANDRICQGLDFLEHNEVLFSRGWDVGRDKIVGDMKLASRSMAHLTPHLVKCEAAAHEVEAKLRSGGHDEVVPLLQIQLEKPMREVLKSLPVTIGLDSAFLQGYHGRDNCADPDEYDEAAEHYDDVGEAEEDYDDVEEGKAREPPANAMPPPIGVPYAQTRTVRFGETSFNGGVGPSWPAPSPARAGADIVAGRIGDTDGMTPLQLGAAAGSASSSQTTHQRRTIPEDPQITVQPLSTAARKRARSTEESDSANDADVLETSAHADGLAKKRKLQ